MAPVGQTLEVPTPSLLKKSLTSALSSLELTECTIPFLRSGIHLSLQISTLFPFPIFQNIPSNSVSLAQSNNLHTYEGLVPRLAAIMSTCLKYLALNNYAVREFGFFIILQTCLVSRALLKIVRSLKPNPLLFLGIVRSVHFFQCSLPFFAFLPHKKLVHIDSISLLMVVGILKMT